MSIVTVPLTLPPHVVQDHSSTNQSRVNVLVADEINTNGESKPTDTRFRDLETRATGKFWLFGIILPPETNKTKSQLSGKENLLAVCLIKTGTSL